MLIIRLTVLALAVFLVIAPGFYFSAQIWVPLLSEHLLGIPLATFGWFNSTVAALVAISAAWYTWAHLNSRRRTAVSCMVLGAIFLGGIGFMGGGLGLAFVTQSGQAPLFGVFFLGPLGLILGLIAGFFWWLFRDRQVPDI